MKDINGSIRSGRQLILLVKICMTLVLGLLFQVGSLKAQNSDKQLTCGGSEKRKESIISIVIFMDHPVSQVSNNYVGEQKK